MIGVKTCALPISLDTQRTSSSASPFPSPSASASQVRPAAQGPSEFAGRVSLPHHKLHAYWLALDLVELVFNLDVRDAKSREQAREAADSCARNVAEAAGRHSAADKSRVFAIARGECCECISSIEIAARKRSCSPADVARVVELGGRPSAVLSPLLK